MLDLAFLRDHSDAVQDGLRKRGAGIPLGPILDLDARRRSLLVEVEGLKKTRNESSRKIGALVHQGADPAALKEEMRLLGERVAEIEKEVAAADAGLQEQLRQIPNVPHPSVPEGTGSEDNPVVRTWGDPPSFAFEPKAHWDLGPALGILDFERAAKIAGARFSVLVGDGALLERALIQFMLDLHTREHGYVEILPPFMVNADSLFGTGQLPKFEEDLFKVEPGGYYLIPTAEVPVTNYHAKEILEAERLPLSYCAYTPCFRSEAGSYGKDVRGLIRQHQFDKVELVKFTRAGDSYEQLEVLTANAEEVLKRLGLPYRVVTLCGGDLGFSAAKTYDLEVWLPGQNAYREISSCSNFEAFQARRAQIRCKPQGGRTEHVHTLNGSGLAVGRTLVAILENFQQADGSVAIPEALRPYMHGKDRIGGR